MIVIWIAAIVVFGIVEAVTVGLVSIWFVLGAVAGLLAAVLGAALWVQIVLFFVVSIAALAATRPLVQRMLRRDETPTNADRVLGQTARVTETIDNTVPTGAVYADGKTWTARSASGRVIPKDADGEGTAHGGRAALRGGRGGSARPFIKQIGGRTNAYQQSVRPRYRRDRHSGDSGACHHRPQHLCGAAVPCLCGGAAGRLPHRVGRGPAPEGPLH